MQNFVAIDPGANHFAWAGFTAGKCTEAGYQEGSRIVLYSWAQNLASTSTSLVIEQMVIYPGLRQENPNDLIKVSFTSGLISAHFCDVFQVPARDWKGQVPKSVTELRVKEAVPHVEKLLKDVRASKRNHVYDAIGIGLWATKQASLQKYLAK